MLSTGMDRGEGESTTTARARKRYIPHQRTLFYRTFKCFVFFAGWNQLLSRIILRSRRMKHRTSLSRRAFVNWIVSLTHHGRSAYMSLSSLLNDRMLIHFSAADAFDVHIDGFRDISLPWSLAYFLWDTIDMPRTGAGHTRLNMLHHLGALLGSSIVMFTVSFLYAFGHRQPSANTFYEPVF